MRRKSISGPNKLQLETKEFAVRDSTFNSTPEALHEGSPMLFKRGRLSALSRSAKVKDEGAVVNRCVAGESPPQNLKAAEQKQENIIREVILPYLDRQIARAEKKVFIPDRS
jgi:hypothetical protein